MSLRVYVASPFALREEVKALHDRLRTAGLEPVAQWPYGTEKESELTTPMARALADRNDLDVDGSHALLVLGRPAAGGEMLCEVARALAARTPIVWTGERIVLSTFREGVLRAASMEDALTVLVSWGRLIERPFEMPVVWGRAVVWSAVVEAERELEAQAARVRDGAQ